MTDEQADKVIFPLSLPPFPSPLFPPLCIDGISWEVFDVFDYIPKLACSPL